MITSRANERVKAFAALKQRKERTRSGLAIAEGIHLAQEALASDLTIETLILSESFLLSEAAAAILDAANTRGVSHVDMADSCYAKVSDLHSPEGVAVVYQQPQVSPGNILAMPAAKLVVLCGIQDPGNAGAIVRIAEATGMSGCIFIDGADVFSHKCVRAAMGSSFRLPCVAMSAADFIPAAAAASIRIYGADSQHGGNRVPFDEVEYVAPYAICLGGEGAGIPTAFARAAIKTIRIPMTPPVESLNVATAAGIILYSVMRQCRVP